MKSRAQNMPTISVSRTRKVIMYSRTRLVIACQLAMTQSSVRKVDSRTKKSEMPSTPIW